MTQMSSLHTSTTVNEVFIALYVILLLAAAAATLRHGFRKQDAFVFLLIFAAGMSCPISPIHSCTVLIPAFSAPDRQYSPCGGLS